VRWFPQIRYRPNGTHPCNTRLGDIYTCPCMSAPDGYPFRPFSLGGRRDLILYQALYPQGLAVPRPRAGSHELEVAQTGECKQPGPVGPISTPPGLGVTSRISAKRSLVCRAANQSIPLGQSRSWNTLLRRLRRMCAESRARTPPPRSGRANPPLGSHNGSTSPRHAVAVRRRRGRATYREPPELLESAAHAGAARRRCSILGRAVIARQAGENTFRRGDVVASRGDAGYISRARLSLCVLCSFRSQPDLT